MNATTGALARAATLLAAVVLAWVPASAQDAAASFDEALGAQFEASPNAVTQRPRPPRGLDAVRTWNRIAIDASGLDHTPVPPGDPRVFGEQIGPGRASRAMAIVHIAVFESVNAIAGGYKSYVGLPRVFGPVSMEAAVSQAAHDTLVVLFPSQAASFDADLADYMASFRADTSARNRGVDLGRRAAKAILALRAADGSAHPEPRVNIDFIPSDQPGWWRQDPISLIPLALGAHWGEIEPFVLRAGNQFRLPPPPAMTSTAYTKAYNEVKALGGDGSHTATIRTPDQTEAGIYWAYDGTPSLCAPPRLYNQIAVQIATQKRSNVMELARLLALVNTAMAEAGIASWESKYFYQFWRPIAGIRESDGGGPTGLGDGNPNTLGDPAFYPLGAPASNLQGPNFTPPFPAYPSGHATFGGALFQTLRNFYGTDKIPFTFVSDEFNGTTRDNEGNVRPLKPRTFKTLSQAEEENGQSRIYLGIHWAFDKTEGIAQGRKVANWVYNRAFTPVR
jgi:hypothetical protein